MPKPAQAIRILLLRKRRSAASHAQCEYRQPLLTALCQDGLETGKHVRRADRLFQIVQYLRGRRLTTAAQLAAWLEISERTVYRDIRDLEMSGVPVEGEA